MPRPFTRAQSLENAAFLRALRRTNNATLSAEEAGVKVVTMFGRRSRHPAFAREWEAALVFARAKTAGREQERAVARPGAARSDRTEGGEPVVIRRRDGTLQMRRASPRAVTRQCEQAFLAALAATANVTLSAAAANISIAIAYRRRKTDAAFAREWRLALEEGYDRLELALFESSLPQSFEHDHWRHNERPATPPMTANQALQLMYLHQKEARLGGTPAPLRLRPGETPDERSVRLTLMRKGYEERERERYRIAEAMRLAEGKPTPHEWAAGELPDLSQVTGWSKASGKPATDEGRALFGGWRIEEMRGRTDKDD